MLMLEEGGRVKGWECARGGWVVQSNVGRGECWHKTSGKENKCRNMLMLQEGRRVKGCE